MWRRHFIHHLLLLPFGLWSADWPRAATVRHPLPPEPWRLGPEAFARWRQAVRQPVTAGTDPSLRILADAVQAGRPVRFRYYGGSSPGAEREVSPGLLFTVEGFRGNYLSGYCHTRRAERTFLVQRMDLPPFIQP